jgi:hypothetical protein
MKAILVMHRQGENGANLPGKIQARPCPDYPISSRFDLILPTRYTLGEKSRSIAEARCECEADVKRSRLVLALGAYFDKKGPQTL